MTIEEKRGSMGRDEGHGDQFPIGMRVLAVDDDPICLKVLETLLLRCQYHVTTTNQAIKALSLLRENKDKFDLVISDVHMPDMDGFKLLEFVGLEMDLPVIMLSANGETKAVMKGITHGACDYLLKPVRIEELKNIWQHVVRRRKIDHKDRCSFENVEDHDKSHTANSEAMQAVGATGPLDYCSRVSKKRKDQNDEDEDNCEENTLESEDPSSQKKPRVIWSVDLHRKFVAAVNQLGIDKAVPKRILDLMNVEKLTRENVASHLQKYRLYLKRLSSVASQQANMAVALGGRDASSYLHMGSFNGFGNFHGISSIGPLQSFATFQPSGFSSSPNQNLLGLPGLTSGIVQIGNTQNSTNNTMIDLSKFQHIVAPSNQHENLLQGIPSSLELDQLQLKQKRISEPNNRLPDLFFSAANGSRLLPGHQQKAQPRGLGNQSSAAVLPLNRSELSSDPSLSGYNANTLPIGPPYSNENIVSSNTAESLSSTVPHFRGNPLNISSNNLLATSQDSLMGMPSGVDAEHKLLNFRSMVNLKQKLENSKQQNAIEPKVALNSSLISSMLPNRALLNTVADSQKSHSRIYNKAITSMMSQPSLDTAFMSQHAKAIKSFDDSRITYNEENLLGTSKMQGGFGSSNCNFDELMNAMIKPERDDIVFVDGEIGSDLFSLSTCM